MQAQEETVIISWRECSKLVLRLLEGKSVQQGRSYFDVRSVHGVREHGQKATFLHACALKRYSA
jgi:hypothetical protein